MKILYVLIFLLIVFISILITESEYTGGYDVYKNLDKFPASKFEDYIRNRFQVITGDKFPTILPDWLTDNGKRMELDGYSEDLGLAFEAQGPHHTRFSKKYYKSKDDYLDTIRKDKLKRRLAEEAGVGLIIIDYKVPKYLLDRYIKSRIYDICKEKFFQGDKKYNMVRCEKLGFIEEDFYRYPYYYIEPIFNNPIL